MKRVVVVMHKKVSTLLCSKLVLFSSLIRQSTRLWRQKLVELQGPWPGYNKGPQSKFMGRLIKNVAARWKLVKTSFLSLSLLANKAIPRLICLRVRPFAFVRFWGRGSLTSDAITRMTKDWVSFLSTQFSSSLSSSTLFRPEIVLWWGPNSKPGKGRQPWFLRFGGAYD